MWGAEKPQRWVLIAFGALVVASAGVQLYYRSRLGFNIDDWDFVVLRSGPGIDNILNPHNEHISVIPVMIYKSLISAFGPGTAMPVQIAAMIAYLLSVSALFIWMRSLVGDALSLIGCAVVFFFGFSFDDLTWAFQMAFSISIAAGLGGLICLRLNASRWDLLACVFLCISVLASSLGPIMVVGALVALTLREPRTVRSYYVAIVPLSLYGLWWLGWGHVTSSTLEFSELPQSPEYIYNAFRTAASGLTGTFWFSHQLETVLSQLTAVLLIAAIGYRVVKLRRFPSPLAIALAIALSFWVLGALNQDFFRTYTTTRYQYPGAVFVLMILAGAFEGIRPKPGLIAALAVLACLAIAANLSFLGSEFEDKMEPTYLAENAAVTAAEISRPTSSPDSTFYIGPYKTTLGTLFALGNEHGKVGWTDEEISEQRPDIRQSIDRYLLASLPVTSETLARTTRTAHCQSVAASGIPPEETVLLEASRFVVRPDQDVYMTLDRFGDGKPSGFETIPANLNTRITIPDDASKVPWRVGFGGSGNVRVCQHR